MASSSASVAASGSRVRASDSTGQKRPSRQANVKQQQHKAAKRRWIQLIESWNALSSSFSASSAQSKDQLMEEISHHAQIICKTVHDPEWLLVAFQMAISAVLFSELPAQHSLTSDDSSLIEQLGQQLLQLAIHSVTRPYIQHLQTNGASNSQVQRAQDALQHFQQLSRRLNTFATLRGLTEMLGLPALPLDLVLQQDTTSLLFGLASLPQGSDLLAPLLRRDEILLAESAPARLQILAQLIRRSGCDIQKLTASGLLVGWKDGRESSLWAGKEPQPALSLKSLRSFYTAQADSLQESGFETEADALRSFVNAELQGNITNGEDTVNERSIPNSSRTKDTAQNFNIDSIVELAKEVPKLSQQREDRLKSAKEMVERMRQQGSLSSSLVQLVDASDGAPTRAHVLNMISQALQSSALQSSEAAALAIAVLYARPAVGGYRIHVQQDKMLLQELATVVTAVAAKNNAESSSSTQIMANLLRPAVDAHEDAFIPASQLLARLTADNFSAATLAEAQRHLTWLTSIASLLEERKDDSVTLDLCWLAAYGGASGSSQHQEKAVRQLLEAFASSHPAPTARTDRGGMDANSLRFKASWTTFFQDVVSLADHEGPFGALPVKLKIELLLTGILRTGDIELFRSIAGDASVTGTLNKDDLESLVLKVSTELFDEAPTASTRSKEIRLAQEVLEGVPASSRTKLQKQFIEASCRLCSFKIKSILRPGHPIEPKELRETPDKLDLVARLLGTQEDAYRSPELILEIATRLSAIGSGLVEPKHGKEDIKSQDKQWGLSPSEKTMIEIRTLAMLADAATSGGDFEEAASFCQRVVEKVDILRTRSSQTSFADGVPKPGSAASMLPKAQDLGWKSCFQLSKHPLWDDTPSRITMLAHALTLCPAEQLPQLLRQWQQLDKQLAQELEEGKVFTSTKKAAASWLNIVGPGGKGTELSAQNAAAAAATAASVGAGLVGMGANAAANLLPLSFSPLSYFGGGGGQQHSQQATQGRSSSDSGRGATGEARNVDSRTAKLFDFDMGAPSSSSSSSAGYVDPTERAVRAARAARDFLGWKSSQSGEGAAPSSQQQQQQQHGSGGGLGGFSLSRGARWLIGEDK